MKEYHVGKEIEKEVRRQYPSVDAFAKALNCEHQTVYDIFKRAHITTDRLMEVSRILNRDFFKELSDICTKGEAVAAAEEDEETIKERINLLMPEDELHIVPDPLFAETSRIKELADEYLASPRKKPLLLCYDGSVPTAFHSACECAFGAGMVKTVKTSAEDVESLYRQIDILANLPQKVIEIHFSSRDYDSVILFAEKLAVASGKFVILYWNMTNRLWRSQYEGIEYDNIVDICFKTWHERIHIFVADNKDNDFCRRLELYDSYKSRGYIDKVGHLLGEYKDKGAEYKEEEAREMLKKAFEKRNTFKVFKEEDLGDTILRYVVSAVPTAEEKRLLKEALPKEYKDPILTMWYEVSKENGKIIDWEETYFNILSRIGGIKFTDSRKAFNEYIQQEEKI